MCKLFRPPLLHLVVLSSIYFLFLAETGVSYNPSLKLSSSNNKKLPKIKQVAIIGAGISGLSLANALENSIISKNEEKIQVHLYDSRKNLDFEAGAGIQVNGGLSILHKINPSLQKSVIKAALPLVKIRSRAKPWTNFFNKKEPPKKFSTLLELNLEEIIKNDKEVKKSLYVDGEVMSFSITRGALQEALLNGLPADLLKNRIKFNSKLVGIKNAATQENDGTNEGIMCEFSNGSVEGPFDLVVGCDGIKSTVK